MPTKCSINVVVLMLVCATTAFSQDHLTKELQLTQPSNGNTVVLQPGSSTVQQTLTLPAALPSSTGQVLSVQSISGSQVTTQWSNANAYGANVSFKVKSTTDSTTSETFADVTDMQDSVKAGKVYEFNAMIRCDRNNNNADDIEIRFVEADGGSNINFMFYWVEVTDDEALDDGSFDMGESVTLDISTNSIRVYEIRGIIISGADDLIKMQYRREPDGSGGSNRVRIWANSFMRLITTL